MLHIMQTSNSYLPISTSASLLLFFFPVSHTLSCNSILMGFIGLAIHLSAAAQFNYIREPSRLSPDNLQHSPPSHAHTHSRAPLRLHTHGQKKKKIQFLLNNGGTEMKQPTEATSLYTFCRYLLSVCVCVCAMCMIAYDCVCCVIHSKQFLTFISLVTCGKLQKVISSY